LSGEEREHGFEDVRVNGSGGVVVQINTRGHDSLRIAGVKPRKKL
jgi:hypothetical protein